MSLKRYVQKRNFSKTPEPSGDDDPRVSNGILLAINGVAAGLRNSG